MSEEIKTALDAIELKVDAALEKVNGQVKEDGEALNSVKSELKGALDSWGEIQKDIKAMQSDVLDIQQKGVKVEGDQETKSVGAQFAESDAVKAFKNGESQKARFEVKNTIVNSGNTVSRHEQLPGVVPGAFRSLSIMPTLNTGSTSSNIIYFSRELSWTSAAAETAEGSAKPESTLTFEEVNEAVRTIPHWLKVSKQALDDSSFLGSYIDSRLRHGVNVRVENQIVNGAGTGVLLSGWLASGNSTVTSPLLTIDIFGLANKMKYEIIAADYSPDYFYMNPTDWATAETTRRASGDTAFIGASGAVAYVNNGLTPLLWGLPVVLSNAIPVGTMVCKSVDADMFADRQQTVVEMFEQDDTNVQSNLVTVRAEARGAALNFVPAAIRTGDITGITSPA